MFVQTVILIVYNCVLSLIILNSMIIYRRIFGNDHIPSCSCSYTYIYLKKIMKVKELYGKISDIINFLNF